MSGDYLNPNHPVSQAVRDQWHKIAWLLITKYDLGHVVITEADIDKACLSSGAVVCEEKRDGLHIYVVDEEAANELARREGGLAQ